MPWNRQHLLLGATVKGTVLTGFGNFTFAISPGESVRTCLKPLLSLALSREAQSESFQWDSVAVLQEDQPVDLDSPCSQLRFGTPVLCVVYLDPGGEQNIPAEFVAHILYDEWDHGRKNRDMQELADHIAAKLQDTVTPNQIVIPISQERHWLAPSSVLALKRFFHAASEEIAKKLSANPTRREDGLTDELVYEVFSNSQKQEAIRTLLIRSGVELQLLCEESGSAEKVLGTDIGFCLTIRGPGLFTRRAILLQAKKLQPYQDSFSLASTYGDLLDQHGKEQANKMLEISPSSFFLLYNPDGLPKILGATSGDTQVAASLDYASDGISVLPAAIAAAMTRSHWTKVAKLYPFTCSFVKFMVDDFIQGKVGDTSHRTVSAALTRKLRQELDVRDDHLTPPPRFAVSMTLELSDLQNSER